MPKMVSVAPFQRFSSHYALGEGSFVRRGWAEALPKRLDAAKVVAGLGLTSLERSGVVVADLSESDYERIDRLCHMRDNWSLQSFRLATVIDYIERVESLSGLIVYGREMSDESLVLRRTDSSLPTLFGDNALRVCEHFSSADLRDERAIRDILVDDGVGQMRLLDIESRSAKSWERFTKSISRLAKGEFQSKIAGMSAKPGWGVGHLKLSTSEPTRSIDVQRIRINSMGHLSRALEGLAEELHDQVPDLQRFAVAAPTVLQAAMAARADAFIGRVEYPDFRYGWHPALTILEFMCSNELPAAVLVMQRQSVSLAVVRKVAR